MPSLRPLFVAAALVAGCRPAQAPTTPLAASELAIVSSATGSADVGQMLRDLGAARLVCFGEVHDRDADHRLEAALIDALSRDRPVRIGLEMVERSFQPVLDDFASGAIDTATLRARLEWDERWGHPFAAYEPIFVLARERRLPLVALNAPREAVRRIVAVGLDAARLEFPDAIPAFSLDDPGYRDFVQAAIADHPNLRPEQVERFLAAQRTWDVVMAQGALRATSTADATPIVVLAGALHCAYGLGIPGAASEQDHVPSRVVLAAPLAEMPRLDDRPVADYVLAFQAR